MIDDAEAGAQPINDESSKFVFEFSEQSIRSAFVKKVFGLVTVMLLIVTGMCSIPFIWTGVADWLNNSIWLYITSCIVFFAIAIILSCFTSIRRSYPLNIILLAVFTLSCGVMVMTITSFYTVQSVLLCLAITTASTAAVVVFAVVIKKDLTTMIGIAFIFGITLLFFGITASIAIWACNVYWLYTVYAALSALLMMFWLAIDVQLIMGRGRYSIGPEDYIFAAMQIFLDIVNIFLYILQIFGKLK